MTNWIVTFPDHLKMQEMCDEAIRTEPLSLGYVPDRFKTQEMCNEVVRNRLGMIFVPNHFWMQEMCNEIVHTMPDAFHFIPNHFKTRKMCDQAVKYDSSSLQFVPDWFVTQEQIDLWDDDKCFECMMMVKINLSNLLMIKIIFLSGTIVIKNGRPKKPQ